MSDPYIGQIILFAGSFAPKGWAFFQGQILPILQNQALFAILGTTYGGNGTTNFALPDLRGRVAVSQGQAPGLSNYVLGEPTGQENVTLNTTQMPSHSHNVVANGGTANEASPSNNFISGAPSSLTKVFGSAPSPSVTLNQATIQPKGGSQAHTNIQPTLALNYIIALQASSRRATDAVSKADAAFAAFREAVLDDADLLRALRPPQEREAYVAAGAALREGELTWLLTGADVE